MDLHVQSYCFSSDEILVFNKTIQEPTMVARTTSPWLRPSAPGCQMNISIRLEGSTISGRDLPSIFVKSEEQEPRKLDIAPHSSIVSGKWSTYVVRIGAVEGAFHLVLESIKEKKNDVSVILSVGSTVLSGCDRVTSSSGDTWCRLSEFQCPISSACVSLSSVCDFQFDCPDKEDEDDELCSNRQRPGVCDFEVDTCGWETRKVHPLAGQKSTSNTHTKALWGRHQGHVRPGASSPRNTTSKNGTYMFYNGASSEPFYYALLQSPPISVPPAATWNSQSPLYESCTMTFYQRMNRHSFGLTLNLAILEMDSCCNQSSCTRTSYPEYWSLKASDVKTTGWTKVTLAIPPVQKRFILRFDVTRLIAKDNLSIDDISLSKECFGEGIATGSPVFPAVDDCPSSFDRLSNGTIDQQLPSAEEAERSGPTVLDNVLAFTLGLIAAVVALIILLAIVVVLSAKRREKLSKKRETHQLQLEQLQQQQQLALQSANPDVDLQLNLLRSKKNSYLGKIVNYNPSYEFAGNRYTTNDLRVISRSNITLVKALGHGAFGEVYQGILLDASKQPTNSKVAIKTLPALSTSQAQMDFVMEALIMSIFDHKNIVKLLGVCFDRHPQFIVLELLEGGDVKTFLYRSRPQPNQPVELTVQDLLHLSLDVAQGCRYLEENHFVHRDIAARNCLISTNSWGRVAKIADFGMARHVYKSDYYKKSGKAMLPVRWMPPEALLNGTFTTKTDVWSFGVLLWEIFTLGYRPYPGLTNDEVIQLVTSDGRLQPPDNCPSPVGRIMTVCWTESVDNRPHFDVIIQLIEECLKDPNVLQMSLCATPSLTSVLPSRTVPCSYLPILYDNSCDDSSSTIPPQGMSSVHPPPHTITPSPDSFATSSAILGQSTRRKFSVDVTGSTAVDYSDGSTRFGSNEVANGQGRTDDSAFQYVETMEPLISLK